MRNKKIFYVALCKRACISREEISHCGKKVIFNQIVQSNYQGQTRKVMSFSFALVTNLHCHELLSQNFGLDSARNINGYINSRYLPV